VGWRREITPLLQNFGIKVLDPSDKPPGFVDEDSDNRELRNHLIETEQYDLVSKYVKEIRTGDLYMVDKSHFMIAAIDLNIYATGTWEEIFWINRLKCPILVWCLQGKKKAPHWLFGVINHKNIFDTMEDVIKYLEYIAYDPAPETLGRWRFFDYNLM
jgi:hypothetical protein